MKAKWICASEFSIDNIFYKIVSLLEWRKGMRIIRIAYICNMLCDPIKRR